MSIYQEVQQEELEWLGTAPVPVDPYYNPAWFELEREAVFQRTWLLIEHLYGTVNGMVEAYQQEASA